MVKRCQTASLAPSSNNIIVAVMSHEVVTITYLLPVFLRSTLEGSLVFREMSKLRQHINNQDPTLVVAEYLLCRDSFFWRVGTS